MIRYAIRKFCDYYFRKIDNLLELEISELLSTKEKEIFNKMDYYDKWHGMEVYKKMKDKTSDELYLKFSLLHDCGKHRASFLLRVLTKLNFKTRLKEHPKIGYLMLKDINKEVAELILHHHDKNTKGLLKIFQDCDDRS
ncbi:HD domain-containing protein [uncultured Sneathia sp.]|uniref:HD domain-containing protein n=1 Tax=uncultured Sneathia sp. TaxID=278067 RepID=UPI0028055223|nr:HD domain-containing protein [uncultured Sneathia sp.]